MPWYEEAVFYHIYPLGLTGAPKQNDYSEPVHRLGDLLPWIDHLVKLHVTALYIGPLFQSVGHGYETTDYRLLDSRLGTNEDLTAFVAACHKAGLRVIFDGVFNHTGRDFFAFKDLKEKREQSAYRDWYCNVNFWGNNEYNDGFSYDNWGGYNLLVKLNQRNPAVRDYICDVIRFWVETFDIDGIRLDAADVLDFEFMKALRHTADQVKPDFWLMGEVIHGDYSRWANDCTLHSVTNYALHKALYSGHNDHNYFEIAHTIRRTNDMVPAQIKLYNFVDNHDVERIATKLSNKAHFLPVHILLYTLPGIPSVYYGSEFAIEGRKERGSDDSLRPYISLNDHDQDYEKNACTRLICALGKIHGAFTDDLVRGDYRELGLTNRQYAYGRGRLIIAVNNDENEAHINVGAADGRYVGLLGGGTVQASGGRMDLSLAPCGGEIYAPEDAAQALNETKKSTSVKRRGSRPLVTVSEMFVMPQGTPGVSVCEVPDGEPAAQSDNGKEDASAKAAETTTQTEANAKAAVTTPQADGHKAAEEAKPEARVPGEASGNRVGMTKPQSVPLGEDPVTHRVPEIPDVPYEQMSVEQLQLVILGKMAKNGPVTDQMRRDVTENIWHDSLVNWANSFR